MQAGRPAAADPLAPAPAALVGPPLSLAAGCAAPLLDMFARRNHHCAGARAGAHAAAQPGCRWESARQAQVRGWHNCNGYTLVYSQLGSSTCWLHKVCMILERCCTAVQ